MAGIIIAALFLPAGAALAANVFTRDLYYGLRRDPQVVKLQDFLRSLNLFDYEYSTGNYFSATVEAVKRFQESQNITPVSGYFGSKSRTVANRLISSQNPDGTLNLNNSVIATTSTFQEKIIIVSVNGSGETPEEEMVWIENRTENEYIDITDFRLENYLHDSYRIPKAQYLPGSYSSGNTDPVVLRPGGRAYITTGRQEKNLNFQANLCTGYFTENSEFQPSIPQSCPRPDTSRLLNFTDRCLNYLESIPLCSMPDYTQIYENECSQYASEHFSYNACVKDYRSSPDFYSGEWYVWLQRDRKFFRALHDDIILRDKLGREVSRYQY